MSGSSRSRLFWHCGRQSGCNFFRWVTHLERLSSQVWWQRLESFTLVQDTGFRADDLLQGAVGDCWFLSALAVIAERPDLILRLFRGETTTHRSGRYEVQLFLEGQWTTVVVDDQLPCIGSAAQRRPDGSGLAFSRAKDRQLWVPLVEKAYAKAHGSYKAISGGSVAEALLDLTGAPCESIDLEDLDRSPG
ncbi:Capn15, partial [Symbiodinium sp. CCMP2456]